jgi:phosphatidylglycerophosphatase A
MSEKNDSGFVDFIASVGRLGYCKYASGTVASFFTMLFYLAVIILFKFFKPEYFDFFWIILAFVILYISIPISTKAEVLYNEKDSHKIVIDEVVGFFFTMMFLPSAIHLSVFQILQIALMGFVLFRIFDIVKPYPIRTIQNLEKGLGVVLDDFVAGIYANICLHIIIRMLYTRPL